MCVRGVSALNDLLAEFPDAPLRVYVVWQPVLKTDIAPPLSRVMGLIPDPRAAQFWDPGRALSAEIVRNVNAEPGRFGFDEPLPADFVVWDAVAVFDRAAVWDRSFPAPAYHGGPVAEVIGDTRLALAREMGTGTN